MTDAKAVRRRGHTLEEAILETAWRELLDHGTYGYTARSAVGGAAARSAFGA